MAMLKKQDGIHYSTLLLFHSIGDGSVLFGTVCCRGKAGLEIVEPQRKLFQFRRLEPETGIQKSLPNCQEISSAILEIYEVFRNKKTYDFAEHPTVMVDAEVARL